MPSRYLFLGFFRLFFCVFVSHGFAFLAKSPLSLHPDAKAGGCQVIERYASADPTESSQANDSRKNDDEAEEEDIEDTLRMIRGPSGEKRPRLRPKAIIILSDTTGVTARSAVEKSLVQFNGCDERFFNRDVAVNDSDSDDDGDDEACENMSTKIYPFLRTEEEVATALKRAKENFVPLVAFTFADAELRARTGRMCELSGIQYVDLLGPMFQAMAVFFDRQPMGTTALEKRPSSMRALSDSYYRKIDAVEFTLKCDDGQSPHLLHQADVILLGVSRTGKTPLSVVLAQTMGLKVANVPLVVDLTPPKQLFGSDIDARRVFCLTLSPRELQRIRRNRLRRELRQVRKNSEDRSDSTVMTASTSRSNYADPDYLKKDLAHAHEIASQNGFTEIDVTGRAVEETASLVSSLLNRRFPVADQ